MSKALNLAPESPTILSFSGPDAIRFLNGQITQDASDLRDQTLPACITDAKGRLQFFVKVFSGPDRSSVWITCPRDQSNGLRERLERYLIADDVEVKDLSHEWTCIHSSQEHSSATFLRKTKGHFGDSYDHWWPASSVPQVDELGEDQAEVLRIAEAIPLWDRELSAGMLPPEAGLDKNSISYTKGCYIGQEVLSRIKTAGKLNRRLGIFKTGINFPEGSLLFLDTKEVGVLTSCSHERALGYLKKTGFGGDEFQVMNGSGAHLGTATFSGWA